MTIGEENQKIDSFKPALNLSGGFFGFIVFL